MIYIIWQVTQASPMDREHPIGYLEDEKQAEALAERLSEECMRDWTHYEVRALAHMSL